MRKILLIVVVTFMTTVLFAQSSSIKKSGIWNPWGIAEAGIVWGASEPIADLRLQGGVSKNNWQLGVGLASDNYRFKSLPMYLQARKTFTSGKRRPFILASAGYNFATEPDHSANWAWGPGIWGPNTIYQYNSGYYAELGAGYAFRAHKKWGFNLSFSYTRKTMTEKYDATIWNGSVSENTVNENIYRMNRFAIRIGIRMGK